MPSFNVEIEKYEIMDELSDKDLLDEIRERNCQTGPMTDRIEKRQTLTSVSDFLRKGQRIDLAARIDELMMELGV